ncbi:MAG: AAA family ATPase [Bacteroidota bacterium]
MNILIFGASGSGTTTLAQELGKRLQWKTLDTDAYYWKKTHPPFQQKIPLHIRQEQLRADVESAQHVIVSGSLVSWGRYWETAFDLAVFLRIPHDIRMHRLLLREKSRYGEQLASDLDLQANSMAFLQWASHYDDPEFEGRSIRQHEQWMKVLRCPVLRIEGDTSVKERLGLLLTQITPGLGSE